MPTTKYPSNKESFKNDNFFASKKTIMVNENISPTLIQKSIILNCFILYILNFQKTVKIHLQNKAEIFRLILTLNF